MLLKNNTEHNSNTDKIKQYKNGVNCKKKRKKAKQDNDKHQVLNSGYLCVSREGTSEETVVFSALCSWAGC